MTYPQNIRNTWAEAYAKKCSAIWTVLDARERTLGGRTAAERADAAARLPGLIAAKNEAIQAALEARRILDAAETAFYGPGCD